MSTLHPEHLKDLRRSGLNDDTIKIMGAASERPADIPSALKGVESALRFPYVGVNGFYRLKLFPPVKRDNGTLKYYQPKESGCHLYVLPQVTEKLNDLSSPLLFVEGEKKAAAAVQHGLNAIGLGGIWNWKDKNSWKGIEELQRLPFADREVSIVPDSDTWSRDDLQQAVYAFGKYLEFRGAKVSVVLIPQATAEKVGLDDFLLNQPAEDFRQLKAIGLKHNTLAQHKDWYESWKDKHEGNQDGDDLQGKPLLLREITPHSEPVDGSDVLIALCREIRRYVVAENADIVATALWCVHAHAIDAFAISPFLNPISPEKGCGKSTKMTVVSNLLPRPLLSGNISPASIFRTIEKYKPSFLIDEADSFENLNEELRGLLNASHLRASAQAIRIVGEDHEPRAFSTWCPKAIALIGRLPATLEDRSITIEMRRRKKDEVCERFSAIDPHPELELLAQKIARWTTDNFNALRQARPVAHGIDLRLYDNWMPLLAVADVAGGEWPRWVRIAAGWFVAKAAEQPSIKVELLIDIAEVMKGHDRMASEDVVSGLNDMADRPWPTWKHGKPITQVQVSRMLRGFGIKPTSMRIEGKSTTVKGYYSDEVVSARNRYAPAAEAEQPEQEKNSNQIGELAAIFVSDRNETDSEHQPKQSETATGNGHDAAGFDWANGVQNEPEEMYREWARIKAEHAARRMQ